MCVYPEEYLDFSRQNQAFKAQVEDKCYIDMKEKTPRAKPKRSWMSCEKKGDILFFETKLFFPLNEIFSLNLYFVLRTSTNKKN